MGWWLASAPSGNLAENALGTICCRFSFTLMLTAEQAREVGVGHQPSHVLGMFMGDQNQRCLRHLPHDALLGIVVVAGHHGRGLGLASVHNGFKNRRVIFINQLKRHAPERCFLPRIAG